MTVLFFRCWCIQRQGVVFSLSPPQRLLLVNTSERKQWEAGALERENGNAAFPTRFNFLSSLRAFLPSATAGGLCGGERYFPNNNDTQW